VSWQSAASSVAGANIIPLLTLGIPGDTSTALMMGTLVVHGLRPGPLFFKETPGAAYAVIMSLLVCDMIYYFVGKAAIKGAVLITRIKITVSLPFIIGLCVVGSYAYAGNFFDVYMMLFFGLVGYLMRLSGFSIPSFIIAFILGPRLEANLRRSMLIFDGNLLQALSRPLSLLLFVGFVAYVISLIRGQFRSRGSRRRGQPLVSQRTTIDDDKEAS